MKDVYEYNYKHFKGVFMTRTILDNIKLFNDNCVNYTVHNG